MAQIPESVTSLAQDIGETVVNLAQDAAAVAGELGSNLVDSGLKLLQDTGVVDKPKSKKKGFLVLFIIVIGGLVAFKVIKGRSARSEPASPSLPEADRLADSTGVAVG